MEVTEQTIEVPCACCGTPVEVPPKFQGIEGAQYVCNDCEWELQYAVLKGKPIHYLEDVEDEGQALRARQKRGKLSSTFW